MVSIRKMRQSNRRFLSQLDDFNRDVIFGNAVRDRQRNAKVIEGTADQEFTANISGSNLATNENLVNVKTLERCFNERMGKKRMGKIIDTAEDRIQNAILAAIKGIIKSNLQWGQ